ncbi:hypothetical protein NZK35_19665 [Stieleria sp. ICT_E10.1]|uniref:WD40 repeat domain-containing protein n=1 Tax=Stieleria sedimenti TaxID=2976331 RepID=UPI00217F99D3|nr:hypothetical protein [Stieleria sedimenti]MCS7468876.1 hypothetical protein [Stieleria sedimenti]
MNGSTNRTVPGKYWLSLAAIVVMVAVVIVIVSDGRYAVVSIDGQRKIVGFSSNGSVLATVDQFGRGHLWDPSSAQPLDHLAGEITGLRFPFSADGRYQVIQRPGRWAEGHTRWPKDQQIELVRTKTSDVILKFERWRYFPAEDDRIEFTADGKYLVAYATAEVNEKGPQSRTMVWRTSDGALVHSLRSASFQAVSENNRLATNFSVIDLNDGQSVGKFALPGPVASLRSIALSSDGKCLVACIEGGVEAYSKMQLFDMESGELKDEKNIPWGHHDRAAFIHEDRLIEARQAINLGGAVSVWSVEPNRYGVVWSVHSLSNNKRWGVRVGTRQDPARIQVFKISPDLASKSKNQAQVPSIEFSIGDWGGPFTSSISDDGKIVAVDFDGKTIVAVDTTAKKVINKWSVKRKGFQPLFVSPNGRNIATVVSSSKGDASVRVLSIH